MAAILVIDDCDDFRAMLCELLTEADHQVQAVASAEEALTICSETSFDLIFCDLVLPVIEEDEQDLLDSHNDSAMVGVRTIQDLAASHPSVPIIAMSGELSGDTLRGISSFGATTYLAKPFSRDELLHTISKAMITKDL